MPTSTELKAEILSGPHSATLAPLVAAGNDQAIANFLNATSGAGAALITLSTIPRQRVLRVFLKVAIDLNAATTAIKAKWDRILPFVRDMEDTPLAVINDVLTLAVTDGLLTQTKVDNLRTRMGSRAEALWGENETITHADVAFALRGA